ncbi:DUF2207 domain-containing protein [Okeanomitos corallinicola TIOX110]|uniref:DUF2207 domain-containing protein n=1 Tax=Okeanomitos corallinicola TIOX110 TaxID=3133117 RepID=A0ABZ2USQ4_9CYAN
MNKLRTRKILFSLITILVAILVAFSPALAQQNSFYWDYVNVNIDVQNNGDMLVTEEQKYVFTSQYSQQRYRYIRLHKVDEIKDITVTENNQVIPSTTGIKNNYIWIRWQHPLKAPESHTFLINYRVIGGLHTKNKNTLVYWKAIFAKRTAPIQNAKVRVNLPEALAGKVVDFRSFGVSAKSRQINPTAFEFIANQPVVPEQELEVQVTFPKDVLNIPESNWQREILKKIILFLPFIFLLLGIIIFIIRSKLLKNQS